MMSHKLKSERERQAHSKAVSTTKSSFEGAAEAEARRRSLRQRESIEKEMSRLMLSDPPSTHDMTYPGLEETEFQESSSTSFHDSSSSSAFHIYEPSGTTAAASLSPSSSSFYTTTSLYSPSSTSSYSSSLPLGVAAPPVYQRYTGTSRTHHRPTTMIEVAPGIHSRLRGSQETYDAIRKDFYMPATCSCCEDTIFCIQDAGYVLCPNCRVISPMEDIQDRVRRGVGLGFTYEQLAEWQQDLRREQEEGGVTDNQV